MDDVHLMNFRTLMIEEATHFTDRIAHEIVKTILEKQSYPSKFPSFNEWIDQYVIYLQGLKNDV